MKDQASDVVVSKGPCPECGSKDNLATYADGHQFCYTPGCGLQRRGQLDNDEAAPTKSVSTSKKTEDFVPFTSEHMASGIKARKLSQETVSRYGYFLHKERGKLLHVAPYYDPQGQLAYQKYRNRDKDFWFQEVVEDSPQSKKCQLFGQHVWGEKHDKKVVVTEGELDAMSVAQATKFKVPAVSIIQGVGSAVSSLKANYRWLDRFDEIILWMDNDEQGQSVIAECASLFEPGKVKTIKVEGSKDASEMVQNGREGDVYAAVWSATVWAPTGIVNAANCASDMDEPAAVTIAPYPWPELQERTGGIREKEVVYHVAGTGIGKTSMIVEVQTRLLKEGVKFGVMRFEDTRQKTQMDLMSRRAEKRLHLEDDSAKHKKLIRELHTKVFSGGLVELFDPESASWDFDSLLGYIRYMVKALDCRVIFIDPLSFLVAAVNESDERKALDHVAYQFSRYVKQLGVNLQVTHHLNRGDGRAHEEGGTISLKNIRGSAGIANFSMAVFAYERNQQGERPDLTRIRVLKNRHTGWTGIADILKWDDQRGTQESTDEEYPEDSNSSGFPTESHPSEGHY